jgi:release factor glutamine methyltransferase
MTENTTIAKLLAEGRALLQGTAAAPDAIPDLDAQLLLAYALKVPRARLKSHPEVVASPRAARDYRALLARRAGGEPLAYLTGTKEFWSLELAVSAAVLIPRPETELLVERALVLGPRGAARVADLGTGSGAVALALAHERPHWQLLATDRSAAALAVARGNAARLALPVEFRHGDWYQPLAGERFDLLVSNPPYVAGDDPALRILGHEPYEALTPGADALGCLALLARGAPAHLRAGGWLLLEHGTTQGEAVRHALVLAGLRSVRSHRDLAGHERLTEGQHGQI